MGQTSMASTHLTTMNASIHHCMTTLWVSTSDKYFSSREDIPRNTTLGPSRVQRSPESPEVHQSVPERPWVQPARRGPTFPEDEGRIPYINEHDQAAITAWFEQNLPLLLREWDQPVPVPDEPEEPSPVPLYWVPMAKKLPQS